MDDWIKVLVALVQNDPNYRHGTETEREMKVATPEAKIEVLADDRWDALIELGEKLGKSVDK